MTTIALAPTEISCSGDCFVLSEVHRLGNVGPPLRSYRDVLQGPVRVGLGKALCDLAAYFIGSKPTARLGRLPELPPAEGPPQMLRTAAPFVGLVILVCAVNSKGTQNRKPDDSLD